MLMWRDTVHIDVGGMFRCCLDVASSQAFSPKSGQVSTVYACANYPMTTSGYCHFIVQVSIYVSVSQKCKMKTVRFLTFLEI